MRFPYVINVNTKEAYTPSPISLALKLEKDRQVFPEHLEWGDHECPSLVTFCIWAISKNFESKPLINYVHGAERDLLLETLSTKLPLELVIPVIHDEIYWKRRYGDKFGVSIHRLYPNWTWKKLFIERYVQEIIENAEPQYKDEDGMSAITKLCRPYVRRLIITQLQMWRPPLTMLKTEYPEIFPIDHINFEPILKELNDIEELDIIYGMNSVKEKFCWNMFKLTTLDCKRLATSILKLQNLRVLKLHRSRLEDDHCQALLQGVIKTPKLLELDLSHCAIKDHGALCIAKVMTVHPILQIVILSNNKIGKIGAEGIGFALLHETCCPLQRLDLRTNPLGHDGIMGILRSLVRGNKPIELSLAGCLGEDDTPLRIAQMINLNSSLKVFDISSNWFGEQGGELLTYYLNNNRTLEWLDVRETNITDRQLVMVNKLLKRNRMGAESVSDDEEEITEVEIKTGEHVTEATPIDKEKYESETD